MKENAILTKRENEIAELLAWGASKCEIAAKLFISERTVENHARNIFEKTGCGKVNELSAWWFCTHFNISFELSPIKRRFFAIALLVILTPEIFNHDDSFIRAQRTARVTRTIRASRGRRNDADTTTFEF